MTEKATNAKVGLLFNESFVNEARLASPDVLYSMADALWPDTQAEVSEDGIPFVDPRTAWTYAYALTLAGHKNAEARPHDPALLPLRGAHASIQSGDYWALVDWYINQSRLFDEGVGGLKDPEQARNYKNIAIALASTDSREVVKAPERPFRS